MTRTLRNFFVALGFACYFTLGGVAMARNAESWLAPVCYHDLPEYGNYRWNCLLPPPPVPDDYPASAEQASSDCEYDTNVPTFADTPDAGEPPMPVVTPVMDVAQTNPANNEIAAIEQPAYFSATDIRRRDWWTPTFILSDNPRITPPVVDESCHTQWQGCEEEAIDSFAILEAAMFDVANEDCANIDTYSQDQAEAETLVTEEMGPAPIPADCYYELMVTELAVVQESLDLVSQFDLASASSLAAQAISTIAPWVASNPDDVVAEIAKSEDAIADEIFAANDSVANESTEFVSATDETLDGDAQASAGFMAYTCMIPYSLTASAEEAPENYVQENADVASNENDNLAAAAAMQKLARQLDWVGLNILRVADHLDSWANQAMLRQRNAQVR